MRTKYFGHGHCSGNFAGVEYGGEADPYRRETPTPVKGIRGTVAAENDDGSSKVTSNTSGSQMTVMITMS